MNCRVLDTSLGSMNEWQAKLMEIKIKILSLKYVGISNNLRDLRQYNTISVYCLITLYRSLTKS